MAASSHAHAHPIIAKLESILTLTGEERGAILSLPMQVAELRADQDIVREGDRPTRCCALLKGFTVNYKTTLGGKRQITAFHIPGDISDFHNLHLRTLDNSVCTLTPCQVGFIQHEDLRALCHAQRRIADVLWRETLADAAIFQEWVVNIGQREAYARLAHLLCELVTRLRAVGLSQGDVCELPMTQAELGDALGISTVHVHRVLQKLRGEGLITLTRGSPTVNDWEGLKQAGEFDPTYLHLDRPEAA